MEPLTDVELERRKREFIAARKARVSILGLSLVFAATFSATWLCSAVLLWLGLHHMPLRYALSILAGYGVFFLAVRVWADYQRAHPTDRGSSDKSWPGDLPIFDAEGCLVVLVIVFVGLAFAGLVAWLGTVVMLEVAFEVIFAGVLVRRMGQLQEVGNWSQLLFKRTWWLILLIMIATAMTAYHFQSKYPRAIKASDIWTMSRS
jgi:hypothetical protein